MSRTDHTRLNFRFQGRHCRLNDVHMRGKRDAISYIERHRRLPSQVWFGPEFLSLPDFAATVAHDNGGPL